MLSGLCLLNVTGALVSWILVAAEPQTAPPELDNMRVLFNGRDLTGWEGDPRLWSVREGVIHGETTPENPTQGNTFLIWKEGLTRDFELRLSYRLSSSNNSGIQYRSRHVKDEKTRNDWVVRGYQYELRNELKFPNVSGFLYDEGGGRGRMCLVGEQVVWEATGKKVLHSDLIDQAAFEKLFRLDDWNDVVIIAQGNHLRHYLNGVLIMDFTDQHPERALREGILALQIHAGKPMWVEFKNIRLRELSTSP